MGYLIDTSVFVAWERAEVDRLDLTERAGDESVALSVITASELLHGVERADSAQRRAARARFVEAILDTLPVLPIDLEVSRTHARLWADQRARGVMIGAHDLLIAATALHHGLTVATHNLRDFERVEGLRIERW